MAGKWIYQTDFGAVVVTEATLQYLDGISPDWERMVDKPPSNRRDRTKRRLFQRARVNALFAALRACAERDFVLGLDLRAF